MSLRNARSCWPRVSSRWPIDLATSTRSASRASMLQPVSLRKGHFHREKLMSALAALDLDAPRTKGNGFAASDERATVVVVHPDRAELAVASVDAWHFTARQLDSLREGAPLTEVRA